VHGLVKIDGRFHRAPAVLGLQLEHIMRMAEARAQRYAH
jgi:hypothetical protein